jgi:hypothetical protein
MGAGILISLLLVPLRDGVRRFTITLLLLTAKFVQKKMAWVVQQLTDNLSTTNVSVHLFLGEGQGKN